MAQRGFRLLVKQFLDRVAALVLLVLFAPLLLAAALAVRLTMGAPVLFWQVRPGLHGRSFRLPKFRTMLDKRDRNGSLLPDGQRLTRFGSFLRSTSLDELPELWSVLRGDMSLVGPRPLLTQYLERYTPEQMRRHEALPGITGWAQVKGRNAVGWEERFLLDRWYVEHWSLWLDFKILLLTIPAVLSRRGISNVGSATMPEFMGSEKTRHS